MNTRGWDDGGGGGGGGVERSVTGIDGGVGWWSCGEGSCGDGCPGAKWNTTITRTKNQTKTNTTFAH